MDISCVKLIKKIHGHFKSAGVRLSVAESCTGGLIGHLLTNIPGASDFFDSSIVCYSVESKIKLLGISKSIIKSHGVISEEVARAMAVAVRKKRETDFSLSITGNLGPAPMEGKKIGLVYMAVDRESDTTSRGMIFEGEREAIKLESAISALQFLDEVFETWI